MSTVTPTRRDADDEPPAGPDGLLDSGTVDESPATPAPPRRDEAPVTASPWTFLRLAVVVAAVSAVFIVAGLGPLLVVIVAIIVMVMLHELGHFATAKWSHMKVTEFFVGFGPRLWSVRKGETEYGIKAIPAGGYVKIPGMSNLEEIDPADEAGTYRQKPFHSRILVASAGSIMHLLIAFFLAYGAILYFGVPTQVKIAGFSSWAGHRETAAQLAGLKVGDVITAVDGKPATDIESVVGDSPNKPVVFTVERDGSTRTVTVTPQLGHVTTAGGETIGAKGSGQAVGLIGVHDGSVFTSEGPLRSVGTASYEDWWTLEHTVTSIPTGVANVFRDLAHPAATQNSDRAMSIIGIANTASEAEQQGVLDLIAVLIAVNIAFAIINMLPMLPLDGGHVAIAGYERIRTRRGQPYYQADAAKLLPVSYAFMAALLVLVLSAAYLDIVHPVGNPFH